MRTRYEETRAALEEEWRETVGDPVPRRMPSLERRTRETGNQLLYEFAYRFESQTGIHPTPFAVDQMLSENAGHVRLSATPVRASYADPYGVVAIALLDMLDAAAEGALPNLDLDDSDRSIPRDPQLVGDRLREENTVHGTPRNREARAAPQRPRSSAQGRVRSPS